MPKTLRFTAKLVGLILIFSIAQKFTYDLNEAQAKAPVIKEGDPLPSDLFVRLAKEVNPSVVNISTSRLPKSRPGMPPGRDPLFDLFEQFMRPYPMERTPQQALGTGFIIDKKGLIVTNNHVISGADIINVQIGENDEETYEAEVIGRDERTDIALIKIDPKKRKLKPSKLGSSADLEVGEWVAAFGNPFGHGHSVTKGIISAIGREIGGLNLFPFIQTDASINPGNSGGPLVNTRGEVVGVNTAIDARAQGIGFAIPIDNVKTIVAELEKSGRIRRGFIGVHMVDINEATAESLGLEKQEGALVTDVVSGSPAEKAGLKPYDLVVKFGDETVKTTMDLANAVAKAQVNKSYKIQVLREGKPKTFKIKVGDHPESETAPIQAKKKYNGQKAPFKLGFRVVDYSSALADDFGIPKLREKHPIIIDVKPGSPASRAGLAPGDLILDVNKKKVSSAKDVLKRLRDKRINVMRILRGDMVALVYLRSE